MITAYPVSGIHPSKGLVGDRGSDPHEEHPEDGGAHGAGSKPYKPMRTSWTMHAELYAQPAEQRSTLPRRDTSMP